MMNFVDAEVRRELDTTLVEVLRAPSVGCREEWCETCLWTRTGKPAAHVGAYLYRHFQLHEAYALSKIFSSYMPLAMLGLLPVVLSGKHSPAVVEAIRAKQGLRAKLALEDGIALARKYAPKYIAE